MKTIKINNSDEAIKAIRDAIVSITPESFETLAFVETELRRATFALSPQAKLVLEFFKTWTWIFQRGIRTEDAPDVIERMYPILWTLVGPQSFSTVAQVPGATEFAQYVRERFEALAKTEPYKNLNDREFIGG